MFPFFGLGPDYKVGLHEELFSLCYYGKGGYIWSEVYDLPIHLRRFYIKKIQEELEKKNKAESEQYDKAKAKVPQFTPKAKR